CVVARVLHRASTPIAPASKWLRPWSPRAIPSPSFPACAWCARCRASPPCPCCRIFSAACSSPTARASATIQRSTCFSMRRSIPRTGCWASATQLCRRSLFLRFLLSGGIELLSRFSLQLRPVSLADVLGLVASGREFGVGLFGVGFEQLLDLFTAVHGRVLALLKADGRHALRRPVSDYS